jgi:translation initiation factor 2B subunit (eIF-2B alpha/beta/delta family)
MTRWDAIVDEIGRDKRSGATALVRRAADAFRLVADDLPATGTAWPRTVTTAADTLAQARPPFAGLRRLAGAVLDAADSAVSPEQAADRIRAAVDGFTRRLDDDADRIVAEAARLLDRDALPAASSEQVGDGGSVVTISASSLVERALLAGVGRPGLTVACLESRPMLEGAVLARRLADAGLRVIVTLDALGPAIVGGARLVLIGGDTLAPEGLVHKAGTFGLALAARRAGVPVYALVGPEKLLPAVPPGALADGGGPEELLPAALLADAPPGLRVVAPYFDLSPLELLTGVVTPDGVVEPAEAARQAAAVRLHPALA